jgi:hypothetical protein
MNSRVRDLSIVIKLGRNMYRKLRKRAVKYKDSPSWRGHTMWSLWFRGADEMTEAGDALFVFEANPTLENQRALQMECADVANFMAMLSDRAAQEPLV